MKKGFMVACKEYFGQKDGQTLMQFKDEVGQLTDKDREEMGPALGQALGCEVDITRSPTATAAK